MRIVRSSMVWVASAVVALAGRSVMPLDDGWKFHQGTAEGAEKAEFADAGWNTVGVPHDWSIAGPFSKDAPATGSGGWLPTGVAWYRKTIELPDDILGKTVWVEFDGVMANSDVWLNGERLGKRPNGYVSFRYDVSTRVKPGANLLAVRADTSEQPASRWYAGSGIYRNVRVVITEPLHIEPWSVFVRTPEATEEQAKVVVSTTVVNGNGYDRAFEIRHGILGPDGKSLAEISIASEVAAAASVSKDAKIALPRPALWSVDTPAMHTLVTQVMENGKVLDEVRTPFGIRSAEFQSDTGFRLNGKNLKLKGVCIHHDGGAVGAAVPLDAWRRRFEILKSLGVNAIRTAHNPPDPGFLDLCDTMGFLVMDEFFDCWTKGKNRHDYHKFFKEWSHKDLREGILRDRNHPSIVLYSVGNEIHDTPKPDIAKPILRGLVDVCHEVDPTRPVTQALFRPNVSKDYDNGLADMLDVIGTNYRDAELLQAWKDKPGRKIVGTEQGHERSTWLLCRDNPQHSGQFLWCGIDYLGESRSWPLTVFNGGLIDRAGFIQPRGWERQSWWSERPMVKALRREAPTEATPSDPGYEAVEWKRRQVLFNDWTPDNADAHKENVEVYSNADEVELLLNGKSLGKKKTRADAGSLNWQVEYQPGTLEAVAYQEGKEVARDILRTADTARAIRLVPEETTVGSGFDDVAHVVVEIVDGNGTVVPDAANELTFAIDGPADLVALDSPSIVSTEPFQADKRKAYQGLALAIVRMKPDGGGEAVLHVTADGLKEAAMKIKRK
ncbi:MAG: glycoside hydrolase family 2 protein [Akkermansiaceae bacterium]|nr:glycoside hydrolase family 2 protein [Akkermansiaceae bacterium]